MSHNSNQRRVWVLIAAMGAAAVALFATEVSSASPVQLPVEIPFWLLIPVFFVSEAFVANIKIRSEAWSFSIFEIPLVLGLFFLTPHQLLISAVVGTGCALLIVRRQSVVKFSFNFAELLLNICLAVTVFDAFVDPEHPLGPGGIAGAFAATALVTIVSTGLVGLVIEFSGVPAERKLFRILSIALPASAATATVALIAAVTLANRPDLTWLLLIPAGALFLAYRAFTAEDRRTEALEVLYDMSRKLESSGGFDEAAQVVLRALRRMLGVDMAALALLPSEEHPLVGKSVGQDGASGPVDPRAELWAEVAALDRAVTVRSKAPGAQAACDLLGDKNGVLVGLRSESGPLGGLVVGGRKDRAGSFDAEDARLVELVAGHAAAALGRIRAQIALVENEEMFRAIFETAQVGIALADLDGRFIRTNPALEDMLGYSNEELRKLSIKDVTHPDDLSDDMVLYHEGAMGLRNAYSLHKRYVTRDGGVIWAELTSSFISDAEGRPLLAVGIISDISSRKQLEEQLRQSQKMEAVGQLAGGIAHDFNNLLAVIMNYADFLVEDLDPTDGRRRDALEIHRAGDRATALIRQLLTFSRREMTVPSAVNLNAVIGGIETLLRRSVGERVELTIRSGDELWKARADRGQMEQVLVNLAVNARDAMPSGGRLIIETSNFDAGADARTGAGELGPGGYVRLRVIDTGVGMSEEVLERIFEPFFTTKARGAGTGLGLSTVYGIVTGWDGAIRVSSSPGAGSTFDIYLPVAAGVMEGPDQDPTPTGAHRGTETIMVVEDDHAVRSAVQRILSELGYKVLSATSGRAALALAQQHKGSIDLVLTDVVMPGMSGRDLAAQLTTSRPGLKFLYMSGYSDDLGADRMLDDDQLAPVLRKPFAAQTLSAHVRLLLEEPLADVGRTGPVVA